MDPSYDDVHILWNFHVTIAQAHHSAMSREVTPAKGKETTIGLNDILKSLNHQLGLLDGDLGAWNCMIREAFRGLSCEIITKDSGLKNQEDVLTEFTEAVCFQLGVDDFNISVLNTFAN